ncbi:TadE family type IV pilus minor pilin [Saccharopolyspora shandongensis]|uniref:TadE family type IV pilus minor pilin n=1 Tax=Saccharopolyspora shandongensis TaxID=418495 RepID=UPI00340754C2
MAAQVVPASPGAGTTWRDAGAVTVEAALGICSVIAVFTLILTGIGALIGQLRCTDAAVEAARLVARGDRPRADEAVDRLAPGGASLSVLVEGDQVSTEVSAPLPGEFLPGRWLSARAVAVLEPGVAS